MICKMLFISFLLFAALIFQVPAVDSQQMPQFVFSPPTKVLLNWDDVWEAGFPDSLAILGVGNKLILRVRILGNIGGGLKKILSYKCPSKSTDEQIDMDSLSSTVAVQQCSRDIAFSIKKRSDGLDDFALTIHESRLSYQQVFNHWLSLHVLVQYSRGELQSSSLLIWNLDPISAFPTLPPNLPSYEKRSFLTQNAISFLTGGEFGVGNMSNIQFIEPTMIDVIKTAPSLFRNKVNIGSLLNFDPSFCTFFQYQRSTMFVTYNSKFDSRHVLLQKLYHLDRSTGRLWYSKCRLTNQVYNFYVDRRPSNIGICLVVSFSGNTQPYSKVSSVRARMTTPADFNYVGCSMPALKQCSVVPDAISNITIYAGMDYTSLVCPIICDDTSEVYRFFYGAQQLIPSALSDWDTLNSPPGAKIARTANIIELPPNGAQPGAYHCKAGVASFTFNVKIVSLPSFAVSGAYPLPTRVFAMEGESISYSCSAAYSELTSVSLQPIFYLPPEAGNASWTRHNLTSFNLRSTDAVPSTSVSVNTSSFANGAKALSLTVVVDPVPQWNFTHRVVCKVALQPASSSAAGLPPGTPFAAETGSDVVFVPLPTRDSFVLPEANSCAAQRCHLGLGATFNFSLNASYATYLRSIGVDVVAYLRLDDLLLTDVSVLMRPNISRVSLGGEAAQYSLDYRIWPIGTVVSDARRELEKRTRLTPVYNLRYRSASEMGRLRLTKERHGPATVALGDLDCRVDPLCFYSTDFEVANRLSFLAVPLTFRPPSIPSAQASISHLIGIIVACLIVILILASLLLYVVNRSPAKTYQLEAKEIQQGHDPMAEARDEKFKEYQRAEGVSVGYGGYDRPISFTNVAFASSSGHISYAAHQATNEEEL